MSKTNPVWEQDLIVFYSKAQQEQHGWTADHHPEVAITDCTIQQCNHPCVEN
jgi:hypothetical protein